MSNCPVLKKNLNISFCPPFYSKLGGGAVFGGSGGGSEGAEVAA